MDNTVYLFMGPLSVNNRPRLPAQLLHSVHWSIDDNYDCRLCKQPRLLERSDVSPTRYQADTLVC
jgi:hypothetical protein